MQETPTSNLVSGALTANTPYLFVPAATGPVLFYGEATASSTAGEVSDTEGWTFKGTYTRIDWLTDPQTIYGFAIALGLLGQKLHHLDEVDDGSPATLRFEDIPYKVMTKIEKDARLYSGYRYGKDLSDAFLSAMEKEGGVFANVNALIEAEIDPRKVEVYTKLRNDLAEMTVSGDRRDAALREGLSRLAPNGETLDPAAQAILSGVGRH